MTAAREAASYVKRFFEIADKNIEKYFRRYTHFLMSVADIISSVWFSLTSREGGRRIVNSISL